MSIEERLNDLEKCYKQLCEVQDRNKHAHLITATTIRDINNGFKEIRDLIKDQQQINLSIVQKLQELEDRQ